MRCTTDYEENETKIKKLLGMQIRVLRKRNNLTQSALGSIIKINQRQIAYIENGHCFPTLKTLNKFAKVFNCEIRDFFNFSCMEKDKNIEEFFLRSMAQMNKSELHFCYGVFNLIKDYLYMKGSE